MEDLRRLADRDLAQRANALSEVITITALKAHFAATSVNTSTIKTLKKERAQVLTIQRERQLSIKGIESDLLSAAERVIGPRAWNASKMLRSPVVSAKLLGSVYPLVAGMKYTIMLQRNAEGVENTQRDLFLYRNAPSGTTKVRNRAFSGNVDLNITFGGEAFAIEPRLSTHRMKERSSLSFSITPQKSGDNRLDIFVSIAKSKQLLQVLQVPLAVTAAAADER